MIDHRKKYILDIWGREPHDLDDLAQCTIAIMNREKLDNYSQPSKTQKTENIEVIGFKWIVSHSLSVSNSHNAPLNEKTNWERKPDSPMGYPGWYGRIWYRLKTNSRGFGSDCVSRTLTYTGTGGMGSYNGPWSNLYLNPAECFYSYDYKFFDDDWPTATAGEFKKILFDVIKDGEMPSMQHVFLWEDEETKIKDKELIEKYRKVKK